MSAEEVHQFWFGDPPFQNQKSLWWGGEKNDAAISTRWTETVDQALTGALDSWSLEANSNLALIILCDQLTRNIFRHTGRAFAGDEQARSCVAKGLKRGDLNQYHPLQAVFFLMPLEHHESIASQDQAVTLLTQVRDQTDPQYRATIESNLEFAVQHRAIIEQFGRFPHRNEALGRQSTASELEYLKSGGRRFGQ